MANVTFHVGTTAPGTSGLTAGGLYFNRSGGGIYYATSATARSEIASKVSVTSNVSTGGYQIGSITVNGSATALKSPTWITLNGNTGIAWSSFCASVTYKKAQRICVNFVSCPVNLFCPRVLQSSTDTTSLNVVLERGSGSWGGTDAYPTYYTTGVNLLSSYKLNSDYYTILGERLWLETDRTVDDQTMSYYYHYIKHSTNTFKSIGFSMDCDAWNDGNVTSYIKVIAVQY